MDAAANHSAGTHRPDQKGQAMNYRKRRDLAGLIFWWFAVIFTIGFWYVLFLLFVWPALAHEAKPTAAQPNGWSYGWECCSSTDCAMTPAQHVKEGPDGVTVTLDKGRHPMILWPTQETIPWGSPKIKYESKDGLYHVCHKRQFIKPDASRYMGEVICVYLPPRSF
jgi:hypothetical protein